MSYEWIPPLLSGDQLTRVEFERRYHLHPAINKAELIDGEVYIGPPVLMNSHGRPHFDLVGWLGIFAQPR